MKIEEIKDERIRNVISKANGTLIDLGFKTYIDYSNSDECTFIYAEHNKHHMKLFFNVFHDDYEVLVNISYAYNQHEVYSYGGEVSIRDVLDDIKSNLKIASEDDRHTIKETLLTCFGNKRCEIKNINH